jgi:hypothetical protein
VDTDENDFYIGEHLPSDVSSSDTFIKNSPTQIRPNIALAQKINCKLINISKLNECPIFHFEMNGKVFSYALKMTIADYKIILNCTKCNIESSILLSGSLKEIINIHKKPYSINDTKYLDKSDPKLYEINNYDINSFEIRGEHKCPGTEIAVYKPVIGVKEVKECKLLDIFKLDYHRGHPQFHFEINGKLYVYGFRRIKSNYRIVLYCSKVDRENKKGRCGNYSTILPSECFKKNIQNNSKYSKSPKFLDKSDPKVFDISNYDISSFDIGRGHKCAGTELDGHCIRTTNQKILPRTMPFEKHE